MNEQLNSWDDLRFVLAVARGGSLSAAARALQVSHPTVFRRINQIERQLGVRLFDRGQSGYTPTAAGEELAALAGRVEADVRIIERQIAGRDLRPSGTVRVTTTDTLLIGLLSGHFAHFRQNFPEIELEVAISNEVFSISRRDADVAIRPSRDVPDELLGRRLSGIAMAIYVPRELSTGRAPTEDPTDGPWVGLDASLSYHPLARWLKTSGRDRQVVYRVNSMLGCCDAVRSGLGVGVLPCYLGDRAQELTRFGAPIEALSSELWLLTHPDLRRTARIRAFLDFLDTALRPHRKIFEGSAP